MADQIETNDAAPPEAKEGDSVEIHRPKPFHGFRGLAKEIGVITIGIAIALGGEETIRWLDQRAEVAEARDALRSEIARNARAAQSNVEKERCLNANLERWLAWANGGAAPPSSNPARPFFGMRTSNWEMVKSGAVPHMPLTERLAYAAFYDDAAGENSNIQSVIALWLQFVADIPPTGRPSPAEAQRLSQDATPLRAMSVVRTGVNTSLVQAAKAMGVKMAPLSAIDRENLQATCAAAGLTPSAG